MVTRSRYPHISEAVRRTGRGLSQLAPAGKWGAGVLATVLAAVITAWVLDDDSGSADTEKDDPPFTVAVSVTNSGWVSDQDLEDLPARPAAYDSGDWAAWGSEADAVPASPQDVLFTVQGTTDAEVTLTDLRVIVDKRRPAMGGTLAGPSGGDFGAFRALGVDLDDEPPTTSIYVQFPGSKQQVPKYERRPLRFPYRVALSDAETFNISAGADQCDCSWHVEVSWAAEGKTGEFMVDDNGDPFRVTGTRNVDQECRGESCIPR